jgi:hypothetical protein
MDRKRLALGEAVIVLRNALRIIEFLRLQSIDCYEEERLKEIAYDLTQMLARMEEVDEWRKR